MGIPFSAEPGKKGNKLRKTHQIQIVEHVYDGSPRWREDRTTSCDPHIKDGKSPLAREPSVRSAIRSAFGASDPESGQHPFNTKFGQDVFNVVTCTNPQCDQRTQYGYKAASHTSTGKHDPDTWKKCSKCNKIIIKR